jgi:hypothetical protein
MGDKVIITEDEDRPAPVIVLPEQSVPKTRTEKEVVVTEKTTVTEHRDD